MGPRPGAMWAILLVVALAAITTRGWLLVWHAGFFGYGTYDDGVYYTAAASLVHGRAPYRDFLFLQPPGILLALAPVATLGRLIGDPTAFAIARATVVAIGGLNAALVALTLRRFGLRAALAGGALYAVFEPAAYGERTTILEPLGTLGTLLALLLVARGGGRRSLLLVGMLLGATVGLKIDYLLTAVVILAALGRRALPALLAATVAAVAVMLPFFLISPAAMWRQIVTDQFGRPRIVHNTLAERLRISLGLQTDAPPHDPALLGDLHALELALAALVAVCLIVGLATAGARTFCVLLIVGAVMGALSPAFYVHYTAATNAPIALLVGVAVGRIPWAAAGRLALVVVLLGAAVLELPRYTAKDDVTVDRPLDRAVLLPAVAAVHGCVTADDPTVLVLLDTVTRDLDRGCRLWPDVSGYTYDRDSAPPVNGDVNRIGNPRWQHDITGYLTSGAAFLQVRGATGLSPASRTLLARGGVLASGDGVVLRSTSSAPP